MSETARTGKAHFSGRERIAAEIGVIMLTGLVTALIAPFGTDALPLTIRFAYWIGGFLIGWAAFRLISKLTLATAELLGWPLQLGYMLAVPLLGVLVFLAVSWGFGNDGSMVLYAQILSVGAGFYLLFAWVYWRADLKRRQATSSRSPMDAGIRDTALHAELAPDFAPIIALAVEDHYVTVYGMDGKREMLLLNLADAIEKVGAKNGLRTHRGWWVANGAVASAIRDGRNWRLVLANGLEAPVSRANLAAARTAGWLDS